MPPRPAPRASGLGVSLLGVTVAVSGGGIAAVPTRTPRLLHSAEVGPDYAPVAALPRDSALLLLLRSAPEATTPPAGTASPWTPLFVVGLLLVIAGPVWARTGRGG